MSDRGGRRGNKKLESEPRPDGKRRGGTQPVGALLHRLTRQALGKHGFSSATLIAEWDSIMGAELAESCQPERLAFPPGKRQGGTLHVRISGGFALELQHMEPQVIERINGFLGYPAVARLKLIQVPTRRAASDAVADDRDRASDRTRGAIEQPAIDAPGAPRLRASLERLGAAIRENESKRKK